MAIDKAAELAGAPRYPSNRHDKRERKVIETAESYSPADSSNWDGTAPATQDAALDSLAAGNGTKTAKVVWDFDVDGAGAAVALTGTLPANAIVIEVTSHIQATSDAGATLSGTATGAIATAVGAGATDTVADSSLVAGPELVGDVDDTFEVNCAGATSGKVAWFVRYVQSD